jgi:predicted transcriptional regulator
MELRIQERQAAELAVLATRTGRTPSELVEEAVDKLLKQEAWFDAQVQIAIDQIARGEFLTGHSARNPQAGSPVVP